jgi:small-conductance mechanosensitive channel
VLGLILLAAVLLRQRIVSLWSPVLLILASLFWHVAGGERVTDALALVLLAAALGPLAARIWSLSDEDWARWEIPLEGKVGEGDPGQ